ncbi:MAG: hypothetical protein JWR05_2544 [Mucilaginibacter sp.]|nr:hypothetical protein [Mucilaginibacter sp.]
MPEPLVSIIIPVYNAEKYLASAIQSAIVQTWSNKEIIIVDDGSTDNSLAIAKTFEGECVKVFNQKNKGASAARNKGLQEAKGEYIQFLDADDLLNKIKIESQVNLLLKHPNHIGLCGTIHFQNGTNPQSYPLNHEWYSDGSDNPADFLTKLYSGYLFGYYGGMIQTNAWLTPKSVINKAGLWNEDLSVDDDGEFFCRVLLAGNGIHYSSQAINYYRKFHKKKTLSSQNTYQACKSILTSTDSKTINLLNRINNKQVRLALGRLYWENVFSFYPQFKELASEAEIKAKKLAPNLGINHFTGIKLILSKIIGWKAVRYLQLVTNVIKGNI